MSVNIIENGKLKKVSGGASNTDDLADVALTGKYSDLIDAPSSLPANGGNADSVGGKTPTDLQNYNNLSNKPTIPTKTSQLTNDSQFQTKANFDSIIGNLQYAPQTYAQNITDLVNKSFVIRGLGSNGGPPSIGDAVWRGVATAVANGNTNLVTSGAVYTALQNAGGANVESGTWTPKFVLSGGHLLIGYSNYWKIGKFVIISISVFDSSSGLAGTGNIIKIQQLPFKTWYCGDTTSVHSAAGHISVITGIKYGKQILFESNYLYTIVVPQNVTEIDMTNESLKFSVSNQTYKLFGFYLTD